MIFDVSRYNVVPTYDARAYEAYRAAQAEMTKAQEQQKKREQYGKYGFSEAEFAYTEGKGVSYDEFEQLAQKGYSKPAIFFLAEKGKENVKLREGTVSLLNKILAGERVEFKPSYYDENYRAQNYRNEAELKELATIFPIPIGRGKITFEGGQMSVKAGVQPTRYGAEIVKQQQSYLEVSPEVMREADINKDQKVSAYEYSQYAGKKNVSEMLSGESAKYPAARYSAYSPEFQSFVKGLQEKGEFTFELKGGEYLFTETEKSVLSRSIANVEVKVGEEPKAVFGSGKVVPFSQLTEEQKKSVQGLYPQLEAQASAQAAQFYAVSGDYYDFKDNVLVETDLGKNIQATPEKYGLSYTTVFNEYGGMTLTPEAWLKHKFPNLSFDITEKKEEAKEIKQQVAPQYWSNILAEVPEKTFGKTNMTSAGREAAYSDIAESVKSFGEAPRQTTKNIFGEGLIGDVVAGGAGTLGEIGGAILYPIVKTPMQVGSVIGAAIVGDKERIEHEKGELFAYGSEAAFQIGTLGLFGVAEKGAVVGAEIIGGKVASKFIKDIPALILSGYVGGKEYEETGSIGSALGAGTAIFFPVKISQGMRGIKVAEGKTISERISADLEISGKLKVELTKPEITISREVVPFGDFEVLKYEFKRGGYGPRDMGIMEEGAGINIPEYQRFKKGTQTGILPAGKEFVYFEGIEPSRSFAYMFREKPSVADYARIYGKPFVQPPTYYTAEYMPYATPSGKGFFTGTPKQLFPPITEKLEAMRGRSAPWETEGMKLAQELSLKKEAELSLRIAKNERLFTKTKEDVISITDKTSKGMYEEGGIFVQKLQPQEIKAARYWKQRLGKKGGLKGTTTEEAISKKPQKRYFTFKDFETKPSGEGEIKVKSGEGTLQIQKTETKTITKPPKLKTEQAGYPQQKRKGEGTIFRESDLVKTEYKAYKPEVLKYLEIQKERQKIYVMPKTAEKIMTKTMQRQKAAQEMKLAQKQQQKTRTATAQIEMQKQKTSDILKYREAQKTETKTALITAVKYGVLQATKLKFETKPRTETKTKTGTEQPPKPESGGTAKIFFPPGKPTLGMKLAQKKTVSVIRNFRARAAQGPIYVRLANVARSQARYGTATHPSIRETNRLWKGSAGREKEITTVEERFKNLRGKRKKRLF